MPPQIPKPAFHRLPQTTALGRGALDPQRSQDFWKACRPRADGKQATVSIPPWPRAVAARRTFSPRAQALVGVPADQRVCSVEVHDHSVVIAQVFTPCVEEVSVTGQARGGTPARMTRHEHPRRKHRQPAPRPPHLPPRARGRSQRHALLSTWSRPEPGGQGEEGTRVLWPLWAHRRTCPPANTLGRPVGL